VKPGSFLYGTKENLLVFERKILRKTFGTTQSKEELIIRNYNELQELIKGKYVVEHVTNTANEMVGASQQHERCKTSLKDH
jgi:hypothetical protein